MADTAPTSPEPLSFLSGGGDMGALMRAHDWRATPLGPPETWPQSLKTAVRIILTSRYAMFVWWGRGLVNLYNDAYRPFLGNKHPDALAQSAKDVWAEIWSLIGPRTDAVLTRGAATFDEALLLIMGRHGYPEETYFTFSYSPLPDDAGRTGGIFCAVTEETQRVIGERRLRLLRDQAAQFAETRTLAGVWRAAQAVLGSGTRDLPFVLTYLLDDTQPHADLVVRTGIREDHPACPPRLDIGRGALGGAVARALETGEPVVVDDAAAVFGELEPSVWDRAPDRVVVSPIVQPGQTRPAGVMIAGLNPYRVFDDDYRGFVGLLAGQLAAAIGSARAYEDAERRADALAELDRAKTRFFSNVSHELRTPLTLMLAPLEELLSVRGEHSKSAHDRLALVHRNGQRLLKLVNGLLDFSRLEAGRMWARYVPVELGSLTAELVSGFRSAVEQAGMRLVIACPPLAQPVHVDVDMWEKIVLNLVSNAFKFTFEGAIEVRIEAAAEAVVLTVRDTGVGIPEHELPRIFERFHRVESTRGRTHEGTGIGLSLVQELVRLHGGTVGVDSHVGRGTTMTVTLPLGVAHLPPEHIADAPAGEPRSSAVAYVEEALRWLPTDADVPMSTPSPPPSASTGERPFVLLADDNADMRGYLRAVLEVNHEVEAVGDGAAALAAIRRRRPDIVLSDIMMPKLDGFGLLRAIREDPTLRDLPVVMLSARAGENATIGAREAGADDYLVKPFNGRELVARLDGTLKMARLRRAAAAREAALRRETASVQAHAASELQQLNDILEERVEQRTAEARQSAQQLAESERQLRLMVQAVTDYAIYMIDQGGIVTTWNAGAERAKGYRAGEIIGDHFSRFYTDEDRAAGLPERALAIATAEGRFETEGWRVRKDGTRFWANVVIDVVRDETGTAIGFAKITRDMTERRAIEEQLRQAQKMEAVGQLTGGVAHDFNNLLAAIVPSLEIARDHIDNELALKYIGHAAHAAARGAKLTHQLLNFAHKEDLITRPVDLNQLIGNLCEMLPRTLGPGVDVRTVLDNRVWLAMSDPNQLELAILNLSINARDAMSMGGTLTLATARLDAGDAALPPDLERGDYVVVSVADTGIGMTDETRLRAFEPFFTTKARDRGTGLGLSMVYGLARSSGGTVTIDSTVGTGTTVRLYLPRARPAGDAIDGQAVRNVLNAGPPSRILVVDDDEAVRDVVTTILRNLGHQVVEADGGAAALDVLALDRRFDLLLVDLAMPNMHGAVFGARARELIPEAPILFVTGYTDAHWLRDVPADQLLRKPFSRLDLAHKLRQLLETRAGATVPRRSDPVRST